ncbi:MAG TPA: hypothetical protein DCR93_21870 [Cytophagales bacterium]|nr:hypothetical protein [Cytophagales bacterium]
MLASCELFPFLDSDVIDVESLVQVRNTGDTAVDGCGWTVFTNDTYYTVGDWDADLQVDGLYVAASLTKTGEEFQCGLDPDNALEEVEMELSSSDYTILYYGKTQCSDPWAGTDLDVTVPIEEMIAFLEGRGVELILAQDLPIEFDGVVCAECTCSALSYFRVGVLASDVNQLLDMGWSEEVPTI